MLVSKYKDWWDLTFTDDYMFKLVMKNKRICIKTLNKFLSWHVRDISYYEDEKPLQSSYDGKGIRLDVYVEDDIHRSYDLEMQMRKVTENDFPGCTSHEQAMIVLAKRMRFYQGELDANRLQRGGLYSDLHPTVIIFFCPFKVFDGSRHIYRFKTLCVDDPSLVFPDECEKIVISSKGQMDDITPDIQAFLEYLEGKVSNDPFVQEIEAEIHDVKQREQEERDYMSYLMKMREEHENGKIEGIAVTTIKIVRNLLASKKMSYEDIAKNTDTSLDEVLRIAKESGMAY